MKKSILFVNFVLLLLCLTVGFLARAGNNEQRIISLAPATTEILFSLGLTEEIVGVSTFCNYPPAAMNKEKIGTFSQPDMEKILFLKPDIIFAAGLEQAVIVEKLRQLGLEVYVSDPSSMAELFQSISDIGALTHREEEARRLIDTMKSRIETIKRYVRHIPQDRRPKVFIEVWHSPLISVGRASFVDELISLAGGINIASDSPRAYSYFSPEQVIGRNPDYIILGHRSEDADLDAVKNRLGWNGLAAVRNNCVYNDINPDLFLRPGPRLVDGLEEIHKRLYSR